MLGLHQDHLEHLDRATVVAVLRAAVENGWATPDDVSELESERDKAAGQLEEHENDEESRTRTTKAFEELIAETGKFLDGYNGIGVPFDNYTAAQREQVLDDARHLEAAMDEALNATC